MVRLSEEARAELEAIPELEYCQQQLEYAKEQVSYWEKRCAEATD